MTEKDQIIELQKKIIELLEQKVAKLEAELQPPTFTITSSAPFVGGPSIFGIQEKCIPHQPMIKIDWTPPVRNDPTF